MTKSDVLECMSMLKPKKCEGFDMIPVCVLYDSLNTVIEPMSTLFNKIYTTTTIPEQWKVYMNN